MKKTYKTPSLSLTVELITMPVCGTGVTGNNGIGNGGTDEEGVKDPDVKSRSDFDDEDFEMMNILMEQEKRGASLW